MKFKKNAHKLTVESCILRGKDQGSRNIADISDPEPKNSTGLYKE